MLYSENSLNKLVYIWALVSFLFTAFHFVRVFVFERKELRRRIERNGEE